ncbi:MAG: hypothetical protein V3T86_15050 [Planctomycetota bacterium]
MKEWSLLVAAARARTLESERVAKRISEIGGEQRRLIKQADSANDHLVAEGEDVRKLEKLGLTSLFHTLLGNREERLAEERRDLLRAQLSHDEATAELELVRGDRLELEDHQRELLEKDRTYGVQLDKLEKELNDAGGQVANSLRSCAEEEATAEQRRKDIDEAMRCAKTARRLLRSVVKSLGSAGNWGVADLLGGQYVATFMKHRKIDDAKARMASAQRALGALRRELADIKMDALDSQIEIGGFATFADYFFDGLIADWFVQSRITKGKRRAEKTIAKLDRLVRQLEQLALGARKSVDSAQSRRREILESV